METVKLLPDRLSVELCREAVVLAYADSNRWSRSLEGVSLPAWGGEEQALPLTGGVRLGGRSAVVVRLCELDGVIVESWRTGRVPAWFRMNSAEHVCWSVATTVAFLAGAAARVPLFR